MSEMSSNELRQAFLNFFKDKGHTAVPSDRLVPQGDPTLLFTGAGMNQFKDYFLGLRKDLRRAASCQKCLRTGDLDEVGRTTYHHTFFEMLGNFSFGDYFKKEAIRWAWEFLTASAKQGGLGIPPSRLSVTVYQDDDEAKKIWMEDVRLAETLISKRGAADNFWPADAPTQGPNGPCGPCSEIYVQTEDGPVEVWNLVFTQFDRQSDGRLVPLPQKNIDTGMGLERLSMVVQGKRSNFETDLFEPILKAIARQAKVAYRGDACSHFHAVADHARAAAFLAADGVVPENISRGYVQRMIIRRAVRRGRLIGLEGAFLHRLVPVIARIMEPAYPDLARRQDEIAQVILSEEENFARTLTQGTRRFEELAQELSAKGQKCIDGMDAFRLFDTYGFPLDMVEELAAAQGFSVDRKGFEQAMAQQREQARKASKIDGAVFSGPSIAHVKDLPPRTQFVGYERLEADARVIGIFQENKWVDRVLGGASAQMLLAESPFYGESGGQAGDRGTGQGPGGKFKVMDTQWVGAYLLHSIEVTEGELAVGDKVHIRVDTKWRLSTAAHHSATHLMHWALRQTLGPHASQAGQMVDESHLRFDFKHPKPLTEDQRKEIETLVNEQVRAKHLAAVEPEVPLKTALERGAIAMFGEKYGDRVRVITLGPSIELCAGTHVKSTGDIQLFKIVKESAVSAGHRRIEAVVGATASEWILKQGELAKIRNDKIEEDLKKLVRHTESIKKDVKTKNTDELQKFGIDKYFVNCDYRDYSNEELKKSIELSSHMLGDNYLMLVGTSNHGEKAGQGKANFTVVLGNKTVQAGLDASVIAKYLAEKISGTAGGNKKFAQGGTRNLDAFNQVMSKENIDRLLDKLLTDILKTQ